MHEQAGTTKQPFHPVVADDPRLRLSICPFMVSALKAGYIKIDRINRADVAQLEKIAGSFGKKVLGFFARQNHAVDRDGRRLESSANDSLRDFFRFNRKASYFDPIHLYGSKGDHPGDSKILTTSGFDSQRFELLARHSKDGYTMSSAQFGRAIATLQPLDNSLSGIWPQLFNKAKSSGEWALILILLGTAQKRRRLHVSLKELQSLFKENILPADWQSRIQSNAGRYPWMNWAGRALIIFIFALLSSPAYIPHSNKPA